jgi:predicted TPR repeat methyltransferase
MTEQTPPPQPPAPTLQGAIAMHRQGELDAAEALYRDLLAAEPRNADAMHFLGLLMRQRGNHAEAIDLMSAAVTAAPDYVSAHNNLGNLLCESGRLADARRHFERALELEPRDVRVLNNLGTIASASEQREEAQRLFERAIELAPDFPLPYENLGRLHMRARDIPRAHVLFCKAITLDPTLTTSRQLIGRALCDLGRHEDARAYYEKWIETEPGNPLPRHLLGTVSAAAAPARASDDYVRMTFDNFAATFDVHLQRLQYRAPELVTRALQAALETSADLDILDAGCGTGQCGALVRPWARRLDGVDLSGRMLEHARARGVYDALAEAELTGYMASHAASYDAIVCADTLCYFGALDAVLQAAFAALRPGGWFAFTLEALTDPATQAYRLNASGRYSHREADVRELLERSGYGRIGITHDTLRTEIGEPVAGLIVLARRPG